jgi:hypothetical protein
MMILGFVLLGVGIIAAIVGLMQRMKMTKILAAPFKRTGEVAAQQHAAGPKELISAQGNIVPGQVLTAPCSGQQCLYYEIKVEQKWEKQVRTENGMKKQTGTNTAHNEKQGCVFGIDDGSGPVLVSAVEGVDAKLQKAFDQKNSGSHGHLAFGGYSVHISPVTGEGYGTGTRCIEKILPAQGQMFAMGHLAGGQIQKPEGMMGKLMLSGQGRDALVGATKRNMMIGFIAGGLMVPTGGVLAAISDPPEAAVDHCEGMTDDPAEACVGRMYDTDGKHYSWTVAEAGTYKFAAVGTGTDEMMRLWPSIEVTNAGGETVLAITGTAGAPAEGEFVAEAGTYDVFITDTDAGWLEGLEGGAGFRLDIDLTSAAAPAAEGGEAAPAEGGEAAPAEGGEAAPAEGGEAAPAEGGEAAPGGPQ